MNSLNQSDEQGEIFESTNQDEVKSSSETTQPIPNNNAESNNAVFVTEDIRNDEINPVPNREISSIKPDELSQKLDLLLQQNIETKDIVMQTQDKFSNFDSDIFSDRFDELFNEIKFNNFETLVMELIDFYDQVNIIHGVTADSIGYIKIRIEQILNRVGIDKIKIEVGKTLFDPKYHSVGQEIFDNNFPPTTILQVFDDGFILSKMDKTVKKANVGISVIKYE